MACSRSGAQDQQEALRRAVPCLCERRSARSCRRLRALDSAVALLRHVPSPSRSTPSSPSSATSWRVPQSVLRVRAVAGCSATWRRPALLERPLSCGCQRSASPRRHAPIGDPPSTTVGNGHGGGTLQQAQGGQPSHRQRTVRCGHLLAPQLVATPRSGATYGPGRMRLGRGQRMFGGMVGWATSSHGRCSVRGPLGRVRSRPRCMERSRTKFLAAGTTP